jgi:thiol:disulfide interchange protein DsbC
LAVDPDGPERLSDFYFSLDWIFTMRKSLISSRAQRCLLTAVCAVLGATSAWADEADIRKALTERLPQLGKIDEITKTPMGLYEVRVGTDLFYTDEKGDYFIEGHVTETKTRVDLTQARLDKLTVIDFASLPLKDAVVWKQGSGARKMAVFADPNCGYCKRFERDLQKLKDVTVYTFIYPILGPDSQEKSRNIWCAKDNTKAWLSWMLEGTPAVRSMVACDVSALERNAAMGMRYKITGTPMVVFEDSKRVPGAIGLDQLEKQLLSSAAAVRKN